MGVLSVIPLPWRILGAVVIIGGALSYTGYKGYSLGKAESAKVIADYKAQVETLQNKEQTVVTKVVTQIVTQYVDRIVKVKETAAKNEQVAKDDKKDADTVLSQTWICIHNATVAGTDANACNQAPAPTGVTK